MTTTETALYDRPDIYDILYAEGTGDEVWLMERINRKHGTGGKSWLEPACGTGRYLAALCRKGYRVTGYDLNRKMISYARRRLRGARARVLRAGMTSFCHPESFDAAFCLAGTFRHLLTQKEAAAHLRLTAKSLKAGGLYILGLDLTDYGQACDDEETWTAKRAGKRVLQAVVSLTAEPRRRRERLINFLTVSEGRESFFLESTYDLRSYDWRQFQELLRASPLRLEAVYGPDGRPLRPGPETRDAFFVLKKA